jgi:hypothetical protein
MAETIERKEAQLMAEQTLIDRYQDFRTRRFLKRESAYANKLPGWRTQQRRRSLVIALASTFAFMAVVSVLCAFGFWWAPLLWFPACLVFFPLWIVLQIVSGRQGDAPLAALDEFELAQRNSARSIGLTVTQYLMLLPIFYLIFGSTLDTITDIDTSNMAYAGGLMATTVLLIGGCTPAMILGWTRRSDTEAADA